MKDTFEMFKFGISNLRRLKQIPPIELKPITLLVGRNSSGKSSFLRLFPLLRQSLMTRTSSPILWYGDLVDFGTYSTAVSNKADEEDITFSFAFDTVQVDPEMFWTEDGHYQSNSTTYSNVEFDVKIGPAVGERTRVRHLKLHAKDPSISYQLEINPDQQVSSLKVDGVEVISALQPIRLQITSGSILPEILFVLKDADMPRGVTRRRRGESEVARILAETVRPHLVEPIEDDVLHRLTMGLLEAESLTKEGMRKSSIGTKNAAWIIFIGELTEEDSVLFPRVRNLIAVSLLTDLLKRVDAQLRTILSGVLYIGPARARSERYYRYQDLSVSEIDPDGKNFPMFLNSLTNFQVGRLSEWVESLFGYGIEIGREGGHISINLKAKENVSNIVDTGYGVSQILPVLGQIWWARSRPTALPKQNHSQVSLLAIEQPELHLHPAHQALLADALVGEVGLSPEGRKSASPSIRFVVETHSETLVNRLGELVAAGRLKHSDVQIVLFEPDIAGEHTTTARTASFNENGELVDWPYGFFQPSVV